MADDVIVAPAPAAPAPEVTPTPAVAPAVPAGETPRDEKGRFTAAKIREAAGLPPEEPAAVVAPAAAAPAAISPSEPAVSTLEDDMKALDAVAFKAPDAPIAAAPAAAAPPIPALPSTPEAIQLQQWQSDPAAAQRAVTAVYNYQRLDQALNQGDMNTVVNMLSPAAQQALTDHIYRQNAQQFAQRFADEANGVQQDPRIAQALQAVQQLQQQIAERDRQSQTQQQTVQQQQALAQTAASLTNHIDAQFAAVKVPKDSPYRGFLEADLKQRIMNDPNALAALRSGRFGHVDAAFRETWKAWKAVAPPAVTVQQPAPAPSQTLMSAPQGTASVQGAPSADDEIMKEGRLTSGWWASQKGRLKQLVG